MVNITVAGGTGNVATELLRETIASGRHNITILSRGSPPSSENKQQNITYKSVNYDDKPALVELLKGTDFCLSLMVVHIEEGYKAQINVIDACVEAGVKRFAPSEWCIKNYSPVPEYKNKDRTAEYLKEINKDKKVLEYTLFQPSIFMDYFAHPHSLSPNLYTWSYFIDISTRRAIFPSNPSSLNKHLVITSVADDSAILLRAIEDPNPWPTIGGIRGSRVTINQLFDIAQRIRPGEWTIEYVREEDLENGEMKSEWCPAMTHPVIPDSVREVFSRAFAANFLNAVLKGSWDVSDEFNQRYPDYEFMGVEDYLRKAWEGRD